MLKTSVIIPVYNGLKFLPANLPAVAALGADEVIIVDDASTDSSTDYIAKHFPEFTLLRHPVNTRFPKSVNDGVAKASGDIIFLLNQDVLPDSKLISATLPDFTDSAVFAVTFNEQDRSWAKAGLTGGFLEFTNGQADNHPHSSFWANGGSSAFRTSVWRQLGGFDLIFSPGYFEDLDLAWRARRRGFTVLWQPSAKVSHSHPESTFNQTFTPRRLTRLKERNYLLCHWKNLDLSELSTHITALVRRILTSPGYLIPALMAVSRLPDIITYRLSVRSQSLLPNKNVFSQIK